MSSDLRRCNLRGLQSPEIAGDLMSCNAGGPSAFAHSLRHTRITYDGAKTEAVARSVAVRHRYGPAEHHTHTHDPPRYTSGSSGMVSIV